MPTVCFCPGCKTGYLSKKIKSEGKKVLSLFRPPRDQERFESWKRSIPRVDRELRHKDSVCEKHFKEEDIDRFFEHNLPDGTVYRLRRAIPRLKNSAVPCIFPEVPGHSTYKKPNEMGVPIKKPRKPKKIPSPQNLEISCTGDHHPEDTTSSKKQKPCKKIKHPPSEKKTKKKKESTNQLGKENILFEAIVLHPIPPSLPSAHPVLLEEREDSDMDCSLTTLQNCLIRQPEESLIQTALSKEGEDPVVFSNNSPSSSITEPESSYNVPFTEDDKMDDCPPANICETVLTESNVILPQSIVEEQFSFNFLKINVNMVDTMNSWWKINLLDDFISFIRWMPDYTIERRIVITKDLSVKVFLKDKETSIGSTIKVVSIGSISNLIFRVERLRICKAIDKKYRDCSGFLQSHYQCRQFNMCLNCIRFEREQKKLLTKPVKVPNDVVELIRFNL